MIKEDYVNFDVAVLLNEKGFDVPEYIVGHIYTENGSIQSVSGVEYDGVDCIAAPTLYMAMKWLREKHNVHIEILMTNHSMSEKFDIPKYYWVAVDAKTCKWIDESTVYSVKQFDTNEDACNDAIKRCLEKYC